MFDLPLLVSFMMAAETRSFTEAGRRLGLGQPTISQHIRRLEETAGRRLFLRDTHRVELTPDGEAMLDLARGIIEANDRAKRHFAASDLRGRLRFGASEDFVQSRLPEVLYDFVRQHPSVDLELTVALSGELYQMIEAGQLDLVLAKRRLGDGRGQLVRRERLVWIGREPGRADTQRPLPLVMFPPPSITRAMAIEALERAGLPWRIVCTCGGLTGLRAAAMAGFGLMVQPESMVPAGLVEIHSHLLPPLGEIEFIVVGGPATLRGPAAELTKVILNSDYRLQAAP